MFKYAFCTLTLFLSCNLNLTLGQSQQDFREEENIYNQIFNAQLKLTDGKTTTIHGLAEREPLIIAFVFTRCSGLCSPYLLQLKDNLRALSRDNSKPYNVLVLSFDPKDSLSDMSYMARQFDLLNDKKWLFAVTNNITSLNKSVGFHPVWNPAIKQFDHDALLVGVNSQGYICKKLFGIRSEKDISLLISSINNEYTPTYQLPSNTNLFSCFKYDPLTGKNKPGFGLLFIALPAILTIVILIGIRIWARPDKKLNSGVTS
ncbi:MAG: hypothetical protein BWX95_01172 [Bacteroidetes bacterium ADurb.Bin141]|nr:hypothetical protein [Bacteroidetes bacterium CHB6]OQB62888.1 MAG: hypothetical protein BWX95_01172 [Bacteroidetes bacterium ADurb.Bin141]